MPETSTAIKAEERTLGNRIPRVTVSIHSLPIRGFS